MSERKLPTKDEIKAWLSREGRTRTWLVDHFKTSKSAVDSWFSTRGFPTDKLVEIDMLMSGDQRTSMIRVPLSDETLRGVQRVSNMLSSDIQEYCQRAICMQVEEDLKHLDRKPAATNIIETMDRTETETEANPPSESAAETC